MLANTILSFILLFLATLSYAAEKEIHYPSPAFNRLDNAIRMTPQHLTSQQRKVWKQVEANDKSYKDFILKVLGKRKYRVPYLTIDEVGFFSNLAFSRKQLFFVSKKRFLECVKKSNLQRERLQKSEVQIYQYKDAAFFLDSGMHPDYNTTRNWELTSQFMIPTVCLKEDYASIKFIVPKTLDYFLELYLIWEAFQYLNNRFVPIPSRKVKEINPENIDPTIWELVSFVGSTLKLQERFATAKKNQFYLCGKTIIPVDDPKRENRPKERSNLKKGVQRTHSSPNPPTQDNGKGEDTKSQGPQERDFLSGSKRQTYGSLVCQDTLCRLAFCADSMISSSNAGNIAFFGCGLVDPAMIFAALNPTLKTDSHRLIYLNDLCIEHMLFSIYLANCEMTPSPEHSVSRQFCGYFRLVHGDVLESQPPEGLFIAIYAGFLVKYFAESGRFKAFQQLACDALCLQGSLYVDEILPRSMKNFFNRRTPKEVDQIAKVIQSGYEEWAFSEYPPINYYGYKATKTQRRPKAILPPS